MSRCLYCYQELNNNEVDFHESCAKKIFNSAVAPSLPYSKDHLGELAKQVIYSQTTLTGVQSKLSLDIEREGSQQRGRFTIVGLWGRYILKPQTERFPYMPEVEDLTMHLAEIAKIKVVPHSLIRFDNDQSLCYITKRIDRTNRGEKLPMEDMCQLAEQMTELKYKSSYERIAKLIHKYSSVPLLDITTFWKVVLFSWIVGNNDMHLKNFSLFSPHFDEHILTPAYDMLSVPLVFPEDQEELALTLNGKKKNLKYTDFENAMLSSGMNSRSIQNLFNRMFKSQPQWNEMISQSFLPQSLQQQFIELIDGRLQRLLIGIKSTI